MKQDEDLLVSYVGLEKDLDELKSEGWVRTLQANKETVLFPIDKNNAAVEVRESVSAKCRNLLCDIWENEVWNLGFIF